MTAGREADDATAIRRCGFPASRPGGLRDRTAYFAESVATFAIVMGVALLLAGIGFLILTLRVLREPAAEAKAGKPAGAPTKQAVPA